MSGHSKWSTIKRKKGAADAKRGKIFTKLIREITVAARTGGGDPDGNPRLRTAILTAKAENMPKDNIDRAIKKGTGDLEGAAYEETIYEGYGPGGVAIMIETLTDNRNRTVSDVRHAFTKNGGNLGETNCVAFMFDKKGVITLAKSGMDEDQLIEAALEAGAEDVNTQGDDFEVTCAPEDFEAVRQALEEAGFPILVAELSMIPQTTVELQDDKEAARVLRLMESLEDLDDVQHVSANFDIPDEIMERLS
ncbi:MAG: YebC/PmpR family DNA-binding transcriptional regulator [Proteobacteria bacterium]|nr:YebC/PmpR family DNA-binding transcriptional regulator [Pseudomonadota bacterium]MBU1740480.1 YebC/PmpR family DNA-binding transcriptional regulator [Pseudomonadota bacterium]